MLSISVFIKVVFTFWLRLGLNPVEQYVLNSLLSLGASQFFKALRLKPGATQAKSTFVDSDNLVAYKSVLCSCSDTSFTFNCSAKPRIFNFYR